jgi:amino acid transporter
MKNNSFFRKKTVDQILADVESQDTIHGGGLLRNLTVRDLTALGIAAVVGAGIFSTIGNASAEGGPAVALLFVFTAIACVFSALCYAEFASTIPISGSAYTYAYASFGEIIAWIIGWDLLMEYAIGNIAVAISWSEYFSTFMEGWGVHIPGYLTIDYLSAFNGYQTLQELISTGKQSEATEAVRFAANVWESAPHVGSVKFIADIPAFSIVVFITGLCYIGIRESKNASNLLVLLKLIVIVVVIGLGAFYVVPANWSPFAPNGISGVLKGVSGVFFAYIGFDAISTTAEECKNPQRDLPKAMIYALIICTILYVLISFVLTGMVNYKELNVADPLAFVFQKIGLNFVAGIIALSAVIATTSVLLVFQLGQPRIWMAMSRDGLFPKIFGKIHPRFQTPSFSTILTGIVVAVPALFLNLTTVTDLTSIGTLFAFVLVCGGILLMDKKQTENARFKVPYYNGKWILPLLLVSVVTLIFLNDANAIPHFFILDTSQGYWGALEHKLLLMLFVIVCLVMTWFTFTRNLSLIPVIGLLVNLYLMTELGLTNWSRFLIWLAVGLVVYFGYGYRNSNLNRKGTVVSGQQ